MSLPQEKHYTYADYLTWEEDKRYELIDGIAYMMTPAPSQAHQNVSGELFYQLKGYLKGKQCQVFAAPFDVRLNANTYDNTVVQPDLLVVCDRTKLDGKGCVGAPDMVIEVLSPSTARHDRLVKFQLYQKAGVREYWIIDTDIQTAQVCILENDKYVTTMYSDNDNIPVHVLAGCVINLHDVFAE